MNMSQRGWKMLQEWAILFLLLIILHAIYFYAWTLASPSLTLELAVTGVYLIAFTVIVIIFVWRLDRAHSPIIYREAAEQGLPAKAKVLNIKRTRWRIKRARVFGKRPEGEDVAYVRESLIPPFLGISYYLRPLRFEYQMRLRISREGAEDYEADMAEFLYHKDVPKKGAIIPVKVHPEHPDVLVLDWEAAGIPKPRKGTGLNE